VQLSLQLLILLVLASPAVVFVDNAMTWGLITTLTAAAIGLIASQVRPAEADYLSTLLRPVVIVLAAPAIWMLVQTLATPFDGLMHPIWASAAAALGTPMFGRMSIDPGATFLSIGRYLCAIGILVATAAATEAACGSCEPSGEGEASELRCLLGRCQISQRRLTRRPEAERRQRPAGRRARLPRGGTRAILWPGASRSLFADLSTP